VNKRCKNDFNKSVYFWKRRGLRKLWPPFPNNIISLNNCAQTLKLCAQTCKNHAPTIAIRFFYFWKKGGLRKWWKPFLNLHYLNNCAQTLKMCEQTIAITIIYFRKVGGWADGGHFWIGIISLSNYAQTLNECTNDSNEKKIDPSKWGDVIFPAPQILKKSICNCAQTLKMRAETLHKGFHWKKKLDPSNWGTVVFPAPPFLFFRL